MIRVAKLGFQLALTAHLLIDLRVECVRTYTHYEAWPIGTKTSRCTSLHRAKHTGVKRILTVERCLQQALLILLYLVKLNVLAHVACTLNTWHG